MDPRLCDAMMRRGPAAQSGQRCARPAVSAPWRPAFRRRVRSPGPTSSTAPGPARTASSTSSIAIPHEQCAPFYSAAETLPGEGFWEIGDHKLAARFLAVQPQAAGHRLAPPGHALLGLPRRGRHPLDVLRSAVQLSAQPVAPRPSSLPLRHGHARHARQLRHLSVLRRGLRRPTSCDEGGGSRSRLVFDGDSARGHAGRAGKPLPQDARADGRRLRRPSRPAANAALLEVQGRKILLKAGQWSRWTKLDFVLSTAPLHAHRARRGHLPFLPAGGGAAVFACTSRRSTSIPATRPCRSPSRRPSSATFPAGWACSTPPAFRKTTRRAPTACSTTTNFAARPAMVLEERLALFDYAMDNYDDGLLFFYFSSSDLQSHMFWWKGSEKHPIRSAAEARRRLRPRQAALSAARRGGGRHLRPLRRTRDDLRHQRPRFRQFRPPVQPELLAPRFRLPRPARVRLDPAGCRLVANDAPTAWASTASI